MELDTLSSEVNELISSQTTLKEVGILRLSQITIELENMFNDFDLEIKKSIKEYKQLPYPLQIMMIKAHMKELNEIKCVKNKWNYWINEILSYH